MDQSTYLHIEKSRTGLLNKFRTLREEELAWYTAEALNHFGSKRLPTRKDDQLIQQMLGKSPNDQESKRTDKTYYIANVIAYLRVGTNFCPAILSIASTVRQMWTTW